MKRLIAMALIIVGLASCTTVSSGHRGVEISWGGETNMDMIYPEGMHTGFHWIWDDMKEYDCRQKTIVQEFEFNDKNNMATTVKFALDYRYNPDKVNVLHKDITDINDKIITTLSSAGKEVVPQYSAVELNISKRKEAEQKLEDIISSELPEFYLEFKRLQVTDVDLPKTVVEMAEKTAEQEEKNKLAEKMEAEQTSLARAKVAKFRGDSASIVIAASAEAEKITIQEKSLKNANNYLKLKALDVEMEFAKQGISPWGSNNVFGDAAVIKGFK